MRRRRRWHLWVGAAVVVLGALGWSLRVREVVWDGDAPLSFGTQAAIAERLKGRPLWWATERRLRAWLRGELVGTVSVRWQLPGTVHIVARAPALVGVVPQGRTGVAVDCQGRRWTRVPLTATGFPFLLLPRTASVQKCMAAVRQTLTLCARERVPVRAVWVSRFGEVAVYLPDGTWLRLGNNFALPTKVRLGVAMWRQWRLPPPVVADLSGLTAVSVWRPPRP